MIVQEPRWLPAGSMNLIAMLQAERSLISSDVLTDEFLLLLLSSYVRVPIYYKDIAS